MLLGFLGQGRKKGVGLSLAWFLLPWGGKLRLASRSRVSHPSKQWVLADPCPTCIPSLAPSSALTSCPRVSGFSFSSLAHTGISDNNVQPVLSSILQVQMHFYASWSFSVSKDSISDCREWCDCSCFMSGLHDGPFATSMTSISSLLPVSSDFQMLGLSHRITEADSCYSKQWLSSFTQG